MKQGRWRKPMLPSKLIYLYRKNDFFQKKNGIYLLILVRVVINVSQMMLIL